EDCELEVGNPEQRALEVGLGEVRTLKIDTGEIATAAIAVRVSPTKYGKGSLDISPDLGVSSPVLVALRLLGPWLGAGLRVRMLPDEGGKNLHDRPVQLGRVASDLLQRIDPT